MLHTRRPCPGGAFLILQQSRRMRVLTLFLTLLISACSTVPQLGDDEASLVLEDLLARGGDSRLRRSVGDPHRETLHFRAGNRDYQADLYLPPGPPRAAMVLMHGLNPQGWRDPRMLVFVQTLARSGFLCLVPDIRESRESYVTRQNVTDLVNAVTWFTGPQGPARGLPLGLGGISFSSGPVLAAATDPAIRERVRFVLNIGGYYDLRNLIGLATTGEPFSDPVGAYAEGAVRYRSNLKWITALISANYLEDPTDREAVMEHARYRLRHAPRLLDHRPESSHRDTLALYALLENRDPERLPGLLEALSPAVRDNLRAINPAEQELSALRARVYLFHGVGDEIIPYAESVLLADALPPARVRLFRLEGLQHVTLRLRQEDFRRLHQAIEEILAQRRPPPE